MKFLFPAFLFALFTIAIPIIIHLFSFRQYKTVYFSNVSFLKDIKKESKNKSRLKQLLILIARILTLIFLVFAFAQPYIPTAADTKKQPNQVIGIYIDNSFSMNALSENGQLLEVARNKALEICLAYPPGTKFKLFTNDLKPKHQHTFNKEQFIQQVAEIQSSPIVIPLSMIYNRFAIHDQAVNESPTDKHLYFISDFQRTITDIENFKDESILSYFLDLKANEVANLYIDSCWVEVPAHRLKQEEEIFVRIKNSSTQNYQNLPLKMILNDSIKSITNFSVNAQNEIIASLKYTNNSSGLQLGNIEISDYPFTHDNNWYISYFVEPQLKALAVFGNNPDSKEGLSYISALFKNDDFVVLDEMNVQSLQISKLGDYNTIFLLNLESFSSGFLSELKNSVARGSSLVIFPGDKNNPAFMNELLAMFNANPIIGRDTTKQKISGIDFENKFFADVFRKKEENPIFPEIDGHLQFENSTLSTETRLLWFQNNDKALSTVNYENGKVWVFGFPLARKNEAFARDILYVPTIYNIVLNSLPGQQMSYVVGKNTFYEIQGSQNINLNSTIEIENKKTGDKFIPSKSISNRGTQIEFSEQIFNDGHYLIQNDDTTLTALAFNYDRKESDLRYFEPGELQSKIEAAQLKNAEVVQDVDKNFSEIFDEIQNGKQLWKWFVLLALLFILTEAAIIRFWK
ncbi:MAG TPA: BatA domain-containing protein [Draconibacterium sp.]|nr:BatA domain-containing protein [Draconibacterium sp.]